MSILSPETLFKMLGVDPALVEQVGKMLVGGMSELEAMKLGFGNAMSHFSGKLSALETRLDNIETLLKEIRNERDNSNAVAEPVNAASAANYAPIIYPTHVIRNGQTDAFDADPAAPGNSGINGHGGRSAESGGG